MILYPTIAILVVAYGVFCIYDVYWKKQVARGKKLVEDNYIDPIAAKSWAEENKNNKDKLSRYDARAILTYFYDKTKKEEKLKKENGEE